MRIVDDALWEKVKARQATIRELYVKDDGNGLTAAKRTRYLFSGLIKCAECGSGYSIVYRNQFGCSSARNKGTCQNCTRLSRFELEARILTALRDQLMKPDLFEAFCEEYTREINRLRMDASAGITAKKAELEKTERQIDKIIDAIKDGYRTPKMKDELFDLEHRKERLTSELDGAKEPPALLHPNMAQEYRKRIDGLFEALEDEQTRPEASDDIRALIGQIIISPGTDGKVDLWLEGDLAGILSLASGTKKPAHPGDERVLLSMVAGARNFLCYNLGPVSSFALDHNVENRHQFAA